MIFFYDYFNNLKFDSEIHYKNDRSIKKRKTKQTIIFFILNKFSLFKFVVGRLN